jgi:2'-5' RNA ligase
MEFKKLIKEALKKRETVYEYGCVMINLDVNPKEWDAVQKIVDEDDVYFSDVDPTGFGRELDPHVTILFGIHADVPDEDVEKLIKQIKKPEIELQKISSFSSDKKPFDVLKFDIKSKDLDTLNKLFKTLPHTSDFPTYHPHATICYMKKGKVEGYIKKAAKIEPINVTPSEITYSKPNGEKKNYKI